MHEMFHSVIAARAARHATPWPQNCTGESQGWSL